MVKVTDKEFYMDGYEQANLDVAKRVVKQDWDMVFAFDGSEGSGKSVKAMQTAYYCDDTFCLERVVFTPREFKEAVLNSKPYQAIVYDEAYTGLSSRGAMGMVNRVLIEMLAEIRQKNLFVFVVMPTFFDLDKYVALWRSRGLFHIYTNEWQRGYFSFFNVDRKKELYIVGKKFYNYNVVKPNFRGRFTNAYVVDEKEYRKKKRLALTKREKEQVEKQMKQEVENEIIERVFHLPETIPHSVKIAMLGIPASTYFRKLKTWKDQSLL